MVIDCFPLAFIFHDYPCSRTAPPKEGEETGADEREPIVKLTFKNTRGEPTPYRRGDSEEEQPAVYKPICIDYESSQKPNAEFKLTDEECPSYWTQVRHLPGELDATEKAQYEADRLVGSKEYCTPKKPEEGEPKPEKEECDPDKAWAIPFDLMTYTHIKVASEDGTKYVKKYSKGDAEMNNDELWNNLELIKKYGGVNVYVNDADSIKCSRL